VATVLGVDTLAILFFLYVKVAVLSAPRIRDTPVVGQTILQGADDDARDCAAPQDVADGCRIDAAVDCKLVNPVAGPEDGKRGYMAVSSRYREAHQAHSAIASGRIISITGKLHPV